MSTKVIYWGTGYVGKLGLAALLDHPDYELVALIVHTPEKVGLDAGEILGRDPVGVIATDDIEAALALEADAVAYMAAGDNRWPEAVADIVRAVRAGHDVVSCSVTPLLHPEGAPPELRDPIEAACAETGKSVFVTGTDPGAFSDLIPIALMGVCARVRKVRCYEVADWSTFDNTFFMEHIGFGQPLDHESLFFSPGHLARLWNGPIRAMAEALGVELDGIVDWHEKRAATRRIDLPGSLGVIEEGTCAAIHFGIEGIVGGEPRISIEHYNRMADDQATDWPRVPGGDGYRIEIDGDPKLDCEFSVSGREQGDFNSGACLVTAWRGIAAIPWLSDARPGLLSPLDLPLLTGRGNMF